MYSAQVVRSSKQVSISAVLAELVELVIDDVRLFQFKLPNSNFPISKSLQDKLNFLNNNRGYYH